MQENNENTLVLFLADIYSASPKDHNPKGFIDEFVSRIRASLNVKTMRSFYSTACRKLGIQTIYNSALFGKWLKGLSIDEEYEILQELRANCEYYILLAKGHIKLQFENKESKSL